MKYARFDLEKGYGARLETSETNEYFSFLSKIYRIDIDNPDFIILDFKFLTNLNMQETITTLRLFKRYPHIPVLFDLVTGPAAFVNYLQDGWVHSMPFYLRDRHWAILHYTVVKNIPHWATKQNFIYFDLRFDHFRYYVAQGLSTQTFWEYLPLVWKKSDIYGRDRYKKFVVANRIKPENHNLGGRYHLGLACKDTEDLFCSSQPHVMNGPDAQARYTWYNEQDQSIRLLGNLDDTTVCNLSLWNAVSGDKDTDNRWLYANNQGNVNDFPHSYYYTHSHCSVYGETTEDGDPLPSEKTWYPLLQGHFILPFTGEGFIDLLKNLGFQFPEFIDYSYANISDGMTRRTKWLDEFARLRQLSLSEWQDLRDANMHIIENNIRIFHQYPVQDPFTTFFNRIS